MVGIYRLYGAFCAQVCYYWTNYNDNGKIQSLVILVTVLETAHTGLCLQFFYEYLINAWGDPVAAGKVVPCVISFIDIDNVQWAQATIYLVLAISSLVQGWYIYRIWQLRKQIIPVAFMAITSFLRHGGVILSVHQGLSFRATAYTTTYETWVEVYNDGHFVTEVNWTFGLNIALDTSITSVLLYYLWRDRTQAIKRSTKKMVKGLINLAFSTGVLTV
ncbi:hypothetical protein BC629DRAFT_1438736 [Irpex lacteus]|nr:hypothetical protein BC629DRAFT_1438736 [Irpex lacteus]